LYDFKNLSQASAEDEDPLFGDIEAKDKPEGALSLGLSEGTRIEFVRNLG
jgi:tRNA 2-thiocytidine biosynthesis protein TtcA